MLRIVFMGSDAIALAPRLKLLARCRAEGVARGQEDRPALHLQRAGELADRCCLARAIDAGKHDDEGTFQPDDEGLLEWREEPRQRGLEQRPRIDIRPGAQPTRPQVGEKPLGRRDADIGAEQRRLERSERFLGELLSAHERGERLRDALTRRLEAGAQPLTP